jgi:uncharacterized protein (DUF2062 family)
MKFFSPIRVVLKWLIDRDLVRSIQSSKQSAIFTTTMRLRFFSMTSVCRVVAFGVTASGVPFGHFVVADTGR